MCAITEFCFIDMCKHFPFKAVSLSHAITEFETVFSHFLAKCLVYTDERNYYIE